MRRVDAVRLIRGDAGVIDRRQDDRLPLGLNFGASDAALFDALTGRIAPRGRLPLELPRSMDAVRHSRPDVPSDTRDPLFPVGAGLDYRSDGAAPD